MARLPCICAFSLVLLSLVGCTHTHRVGYSTVDYYERINERAQRRTVTLVLGDGQHVRTRDLHIASDSTYWIERRTGELGRIGTEGVVAVQFTRRGRGALEGLLLVAAAGGAVGFGIGRGEHNGNSLLSSASAQGMIYAIALSIPSALAGALAGAVMKSRDVYYLADSPEPIPSGAD